GDRPVPSARVRRIVGGEAAAERLARRGCLVARERMRHKRERAQKIVAWNLAAAPPADAKEEKVREILTATRGPLPVPILLKAGASRAIVARLEKEGKLTSWEEPLVAHTDAESAEDAWETDFVPPANILNAEQKSALASAGEWLAEKSFVTSLLHGVTGSGKTEVYLGAVEATLAQQRTAIVLVPEIALTLWLSRLVRARFGGIVAVLHSGLADNERSREWWRVRRGEARVVVGTRSAVFAPLENVGLIIVDEEQESSYKQEETPRYNGRDVAIVRARLENAVASRLCNSFARNFSKRAHGKISSAPAHLARRRSPARISEARGLAPGIQEEPSLRARFVVASQGSRRAIFRRHAGINPDQPPRIFVVCPLPKLRRGNRVPELQHRAFVP